MISHADKCVFVHVPKCAGQSVETFFLARLGLDWESRAPLLLLSNEIPKLGPPRLAHLRARDYVANRWMTPEQFRTYFKFAFVRNPWDRTASFYRFMGYHRRCSFPRFVRRHLPRLLRGDKAWLLRPQAEYLLDAEGNLLVDFVGRFETLQQDFSRACAAMGIADARLPHVNSSRVPRSRLPRLMRLMRPRDVPYRELYDDAARRMVASLYAADVAAFAYEF